MVPPAPVTSTRRPCTSRAMPSRSSGTCGRSSSSSMPTSRSCRRGAPPSLQEVGAALRRRVERGDGRGAAHRHAVAVGGVHQALQRQALHVPGGEHDQRRQPPVVRASHSSTVGDLVHRAEDGVAVDAPPRLAGAHGEDADHAVAGRPLAGQGADEEVGAVARADQQHGLRLRAGVRPAAAVVDAGGDARQAEQHGERQRVDDRKGRVGRALGAEREQPAPEQRRPAHRGDGDAQQVGQAGVAPVLLRQPHRQPGQQQRRRRRRAGRRTTTPRRGQGAAASSIAAGSASAASTVSSARLSRMRWGVRRRAMRGAIGSGGARQCGAAADRGGRRRRRARALGSSVQGAVPARWRRSGRQLQPDG